MKIKVLLTDPFERMLSDFICFLRGFKKFKKCLVGFQAVHIVVVATLQILLGGSLFFRSPLLKKT